jgi:hypothetical protein
MRNFILFAIVFALGVLFTLCKKTKDCSYEKSERDKAAEIATTDSIAFVNYVETRPEVIKGIIRQQMEAGKSEVEAWEYAINLIFTTPDCPQYLYEWALIYKELLDKFNKSVADRQRTYNDWEKCQLKP